MPSLRDRLRLDHRTYLWLHPFLTFRSEEHKLSTRVDACTSPEAKCRRCPMKIFFGDVFPHNRELTENKVVAILLDVEQFAVLPRSFHQCHVIYGGR